jgi:hypothetical protein
MKLMILAGLVGSRSIDLDQSVIKQMRYFVGM